MKTPAGVKVVPCEGCGQPIFFARTPKGARMPMDASSLIWEQDGVDDRGAPTVRVRPNAWVSHFRTCRKVEQFSKRAASPTTEGQCPPNASTPTS